MTGRIQAGLATDHNMMTFNLTKLLLPCTIVGLLGTLACDLGPKSIGNDGGSETDSGDGDGDGDSGDGDGDGDSGDGDGDGDSETGDAMSGCGDESSTIIEDLDAEIPGLLITPAEFIDNSVGTYIGELNWLDGGFPVQVTHAGTSSVLTATVSYDAGTVRYVEVELAGQFPNGQLGGIPCTNTLEVDVTLDFVTADGVFDESMAVQMVAASEPDAEQPAFYFSVDMAALQGTLSEDDFTADDNGTITDYVLLAGFQEDQFGGSFNVQVESDFGGGFGSLATFVGDKQ